MFTAGGRAAGERTVSEAGVPQGRCCSPILAHIFAHHVIDAWGAAVGKRPWAGPGALSRYADAAISCCQETREAERILRALRHRLATDRLRLHDEQTRLGPFSTQAARHGEPQGACEFLGCVGSLGRSRQGGGLPTLQTRGKRLRPTLPRGKEGARPVKDTVRLPTRGNTFWAKLRGHLHDYGVSCHLAHVRRVLHGATRLRWKGVNRRSQRRSMQWEQFQRFLQRHPLPRAKIYHALF